MYKYKVGDIIRREDVYVLILRIEEGMYCHMNLHNGSINSIGTAYVDAISSIRKVA